MIQKGEQLEEDLESCNQLSKYLEFLRLTLTGEERAKDKTSADELASTMQTFSGKVSELEFEHMALLSLASPVANARVRNSATQDM